MGGIYNDWLNKETGKIESTFSVITTPANAIMSKIHNQKLRMPFILPNGLERHWLNANLNDNEIIELMQPLPEEQLVANTISKLITNKNKNPDTAEVQLQFEYPELDFFESLNS